MRSLTALETNMLATLVKTLKHYGIENKLNGQIVASVGLLAGLYTPLDTPPVPLAHILDGLNPPSPLEQQERQQGQIPKSMLGTLAVIAGLDYSPLPEKPLSRHHQLGLDHP
jgi:hypothetical protein